MVKNSDVDVVAPEFPKPLDIVNVSMYGLSILSAAMFMFLPFFNLLHPSPWQRWMGTIHGMAAILATIVAAYTGHLAFPLLRGVHRILQQMRILIFWTTFLALLAIVSGNWAYMRFRAGLDVGGAGAWLEENTPLVRYTIAEYHELSVMFILPLGGACTWILWKYSDSILKKENRPILAVTCIAIISIMFFAMGGLVSGIGIAKIHAL